MLLHGAPRKMLACSGNHLYNIIHTAYPDWIDGVKKKKPEKREVLWLYAILTWWLGTGAILPLVY